MTNKGEVYRCRVCSNMVEVIRASVGELVCCRQPMELLIEKTNDMGQEKHVPVIENAGSGIRVKVGSVPHPMTMEHYIEWIQVITKDGKRCRKFLNAGEAPEAEFPVKAKDVAMAREFCNVHGLWKK